MAMFLESLGKNMAIGKTRHNGAFVNPAADANKVNESKLMIAVVHHFL